MTLPPITNHKIKSDRKTFSVKIIINLLIVCLLIIGVVFSAAPGYLQGGKWVWSDIPPMNNARQMRKLLTTGLELPDWQTIQKKEIRLGGNKWLVQAMTKDSPFPILLLLAPQTYYTNKPYVEWTDIQGLEKWKTDSHRELEFTVQQGSNTSEVKARFFRAWNRQTFAIVQWYAFPDGGNPASSAWFLRDQVAQLEQKRVPWIAVCLKIPIKPLDNLDSASTLATSLGQKVQASLQENIFNVSVQPKD